MAAWLIKKERIFNTILRQKILRLAILWGEIKRQDFWQIAKAGTLSFRKFLVSKRLVLRQGLVCGPSVNNGGEIEHWYLDLSSVVKARWQGNDLIPQQYQCRALIKL